MDAIKCLDCGKELLGKRAYAGHAWLAHQKRPGWKFESQQKLKEWQAYGEKVKKETGQLRVAISELEFENARLKMSIVVKDGKYCSVCGKAMSEHKEQDGGFVSSGTKRVVCPNGGG